MADHMQAVVLTGHGGPDRLEYRHDVPVPRPGVGEVLIAVRAAGVNNTDINTRVGWYASTDAPDGAAWTGSPVAFPRIQGADACGAIVEVGRGVSEGRIGERVVVRSCLRSLRKDGVDPWLGSEIDGAFAQFVCVPAAEAFRVESELSDVELAAAPCSYGTAENLLERARVIADERVLVTGASGGVGGAAVQLARRRDARVVAVAASDKAPEVRALGAAEVLDRNADLVEELGQRSIDVVIDLVGGPRWPDLLRVLRRGGRYAASGAIGGPRVELDLRTLYLNDLTLLGCTSWADGVFENLVGYLERREIVPTVAATFPLERIAEAQAAFEAKRHVGKIVLVVPAAG
ncbi:MAG TPA: zinc-binding dehydrogenase [Candidatus Limnocylindrales bacterium]|nr:zinc-binding dehydrogenase [Candidatus Limnocylindrales bacterium]